MSGHFLSSFFSLISSLDDVISLPPFILNTAIKIRLPLYIPNLSSYQYHLQPLPPSFLPLPSCHPSSASLLSGLFFNAVLLTWLVCLGRGLLTWHPWRGKGVEHDRQAASRGLMMLDADEDEDDEDDGVMTKRRHENGQVAVWGGWLSATGDIGLVQAFPTIRVPLLPKRGSPEKCMIKLQWLSTVLMAVEQRMERASVQKVWPSEE